MISEEQVSTIMYKTHPFTAIVPANAEDLTRPPLQTWSQRNLRVELQHTCVSENCKRRKDACEHSRSCQAVEEGRARRLFRHL
jgi:hypothetical protein